MTLDDAIAVSGKAEVDFIALHEALERLALLHERQARLVELRFFGGLGMDEMVPVLGVSRRTVERDWKMARAWLRLELSRQRDCREEA